MKNNSQKLGKEGEKMALEFLIQQGYAILETNWRFKKYEVDIIGQRDNIVVFFEVKARSTNAFGEPELFVNKKKQGFLVAAANQYLQNKAVQFEARFDVLSLLPINNNLTVKHLEGAFYPSVK